MIPKEWNDYLNAKIKYYSETHESGCILWRASTNGQNIARLNYRYTVINVNRYVLERKLGREITKGYEACHTCDNVNGVCINEDHLFEAPHYINMLDASVKNRFGDRKGDNNRNAKLTEELVRKIKEEIQLGYNDLSLAVKYKVDKSSIGRIRRKETWCHI